MYLKTKDCAKILCDLHGQCFNRMGNERITIPISVPGCQLDKYNGTALTFEEIWAYEHGVFFLEDSNPNILEMKREWNVHKGAFLIWTCAPVYKLICNTDIVYTDALHEFIVQKGLGKDVFENSEEMREWLRFESESIRRDDAKKIVKNLKSFLKKRSC